MHKYTFCSGKEKIDVLIKNIKYLCGDNYEVKDKIIKVCNNYFSKVGNSEFAIENGISSYVEYDESLLSISDYDFYYVSTNYDMNSDIKLGAKSISLAYINALFENVEYKEEFQTISVLFNEMVDGLYAADSENIQPLFGFDLNKKNLIKLISMHFVEDDNIINNYDLSLEDRIMLQINMIKEIAIHTNHKILIVIDAPFLSINIVKALEQIKGDVFVFFEKTNDESIEQIMFLNDYCIDLSDENKLFELCNNSNKHLTIQEMKNELIDNYLKPRIISK